MKYVLDTHTHSLASGHSYSTIREMAHMASEKGLELLGITEHGPRMPGSCHDFYFTNLKVVSRKMCGVELLLGVELNILDFEGNVDLNDFLLDQMDIAIASMHLPCIKPGTREENTRAYLNVMKNRNVSIIGHPDDARFPVEYDALVYAAKENQVLLELNNASLNPQGARVGAEENDLIMLEKCKEYEVPIILGSDAHVDEDILKYELAEKVVKKADFPASLIINDSVAKLKKYLDRK